MWPRSLPLTAILLAVALASMPARAQQTPQPTPTHIQAARELVVLVGSDGTIDRLLPEIVKEIRQQAITRPEIAKDLDEVLKGLDPEFKKARDQAVGLMALTYAKYMTEAEIRNVIVFFKTPAGMKYVQVQGDLTDDIVDQISAWSQLASRDMMAKVRVEMQKRGQVMQ